MRLVAACGAGFAALESSTCRDDVLVDGVPLAVALLRAPCDIVTREPHGAHDVLIRVRAFSCNYRDKGLLLLMATHCRQDGYYVTGSEFVGDVVAIGAAVDSVRPGDRVIGDNAQPTVPVDWPAGIPTNHASREFLRLHERKVMRIPPDMPDVDAAAFSLGAQTAYSMVGKANVRRGDRVLVTSARSNTSLFVLAALHAKGVRAIATTTNPHGARSLEARGADRTFVVPRDTSSFADVADLAACAAERAGFDAIIDPFFDLHLARAMPLLKPGGCYVTCGLKEQHPAMAAATPVARDSALLEALRLAVIKNVHVIGNCLGETAHLAGALDDYTALRLGVAVDSVFTDGAVGAFFRRTFSDRARCGKVVFTYA